MHPFSTHIPILLACLRRTSGPILELGGGWFSTPLIHAFSIDRVARTVETSKWWCTRIANICVIPTVVSHKHQLSIVDDYDRAVIDDYRWSVGLVDNDPLSRRSKDLARLADHCDLIVVHDAQHEECGFEPVFKQFKYRYDYTRLFPHTAVVSNVEPLDWIEDLIKPLW